MTDPIASHRTTHVDAPTGPHGADDHGETHGHDDHAHGSDVLGPVDVRAWGAGLGGILLGLIVAVCLAVATGSGG